MSSGWSRRRWGASWAAGCWPAPVPDSDHGDADARAFKLRGLGMAQRQPQMPMTAMVAIPLHSASCRPRHRVTARRVRGARGSVRGEGSVSQAWSCQSVQSLPSPYPVARIRNQSILIKHVCQMSYTMSGTMSGTIFYQICIVQISGLIWDQI